MHYETVVSELYGLLPEEFAAVRKVRAGEAQAEGNRDLAAAIRKLRRPTTSAWLANVLVRERPAEIANLLALGSAMFTAQSNLAAGDMRRLSRERQRMVTSLTDDALQLAHDIGREVNESTTRELEATLDAAIANSEARDALASGHLVSALEYSGFGIVELGGEVRTPSKSVIGTNGRPRTTEFDHEKRTVGKPPQSLVRAEREEMRNLADVRLL